MLGGGVMQLSLFQFPDEAPLFRARSQSQSDQGDQWWLAMLRGPRSFSDDDEELHGRHGAGDSVLRQTSFADFH